MGKINLCRIIFEFTPRVGGSITHTIELSKNMSPHLKKQFIIAPVATENTCEPDKAFPFDVYRVSFYRFKLLSQIKQRFLHWLPLAPLIHISFGISAIQKCFWLNKNYGIDVIQGHGIGAGAAATIAGIFTRRPVVWMMHGTGLAYSKISGIYENIITKLFPPAHAFVLDDGSPAPAKFKKMLKDKCTVVYHGIDIDFFKPKERSLELLRHLNINPDAFLILSPHSLSRVKGIEYGIVALSHFLQLGIKDVLLLIAGEGSLNDTLRKLVYDLKLQQHVRFLGEIPNFKMPELFSISDIVIATSLYSNMNRSTQEAMACGKPVVAFNAGNTSKTVIHGKTGLLVKPGDIQELTDSLLNLYYNDNLRKELGQNARAFIINNRSWDSRIEIELNVYKSILNKNKVLS